MPSTAEKRRTFRALHDSGCFILPNPFDVGSARYLQSLGFKALATTSSGAAWSMGLADDAAPLDAVLDGLAVAGLAALGVRRISVGGLLARMAWTGVIAAARDLAEGRFDAFADATPGGPLNAFFAADAKRRAVV
jgi:2-methylisocitrate lyase-like PEP mutase family enzyme